MEVQQAAHADTEGGMEIDMLKDETDLRRFLSVLKREQRDEDDDATHNHKHVGPVVDGLEHCRPDYRANIAASADDPRRDANLGRTNEGHLTPGRTTGSAGD